jgi:hypothetical protein
MLELIDQYRERIIFLQNLCDKAKIRKDKTNVRIYRHIILELENVITDLCKTDQRQNTNNNQRFREFINTYDINIEKENEILSGLDHLEYDDDTLYELQIRRNALMECYKYINEN